MEDNDFEILLIDVTFYTRYVKKLTFISNKKGEKIQQWLAGQGSNKDL